MPAKFYAGRRLSYSGTLCTVRYSGPVQGTKGDWLGVEWDDANKGKHFGEHDGVKYFECEVIQLPGMGKCLDKLARSEQGTDCRIIRSSNTTI